MTTVHLARDFWTRNTRMKVKAARSPLARRVYRRLRDLLASKGTR